MEKEEKEQEEDDELQIAQSRGVTCSIKSKIEN